MFPRILAIPLSAIGLSVYVNAEPLPKAMVENASKEIDYIITSGNEKEGVEALPIADDATFLRRAYLNIIGRIPTLEESKTFLDSKDPAKREQLVDLLVQSPGFNSHLLNFYADLLRLENSSGQSGLGWELWLKESIREDKPYDQMVYEMLTATGHCADEPAVGYYLRDRGMLLDNVSNTAKVFLGTQIGCAQCHDHPFEDTTQKEYYQLAAFAAPLQYSSQRVNDQVRSAVEYQIEQHMTNVDDITPKQAKRLLHKRKRQMTKDIMSIFKNYHRSSISLNEKLTMKLPHNYQYNDAEPNSEVTPHVLFGKVPLAHDKADATSLDQFAAWVTDRGNPLFTRVFINRLWKHAFGYGLVEPLDNWTDRTKISHPEVLDTLEQIAHASDYNTREILRVMFHTALFQREAYNQELSGGESYDFRGMVLKRMSAAQFYDSMLTIEFGNVDDQVNEQKQVKWEEFQSEVNFMLTASPRQLIELDEKTDAVEEATKELQRKATQLRTEKNKLAADGQQMKANKKQRELNAVYKEIKEVKRMAMEAESMEMKMTSNNYNLKAKAKKRMRASEMNTPFYPGSINRQFGASDRKTTNAQNTDATIPQALVLLNGYQVHNTITTGVLAKNMRKSGKAEDRLNTLFLTIYNAYPTPEERKRFSDLHRNRKDAELLGKAMLNSKRFLFIQ
ncbi:DUF1549 domain-containing protein [Rubritalea marina]|uniref:DUF1549 domain-containing protein n=1 Tax=Rubritalea marina TaxID=361055 RepID=UPI00036DCE27|nr:DUF1549 domain-containing protein [Rubritalea marina]